MPFRRIIFWLHLVCGVIAGLVIAIMSFTGAALAFEKQILAWAGHDARHVAPPSPSAPRLSLDDLLARARTYAPDAQPSSVTISADPAAAVAISFGRESVVYANPYSGELRTPSTTRARDFLRTMENWHRWLALSDDHRATGRAVTGVCNATFLVLAVTGLYLWWPRTWSRRALRAIVLFDFRARGRARDWNWHNAAGSWCALVLIVLTASGLVMSYRWANNLVYRVAGETPPAARGPGGFGDSAVAVPAPPPGARPLGYAALLASAQKEVPAWDTISFRLGGPIRGTRSDRPAGTPPPGRQRRGAGERDHAVAAVSVSVHPRHGWPLFAATTLALDPFTGAVLQRENFSALGAGRRARLWLRFLHTGEALGVAGQLVAALASLGGCVLVYTGLALAWRRFVSRAS
ncbi:MAG TPA: PepSY-associated TM helix domain-containing protein [Opitutus sp.]|nr:PepSY-associated TM helix domain-containing protein [Opitutus sp.]